MVTCFYPHKKQHEYHCCYFLRCAITGAELQGHSKGPPWSPHRILCWGLHLPSVSSRLGASANFFSLKFDWLIMMPRKKYGFCSPKKLPSNRCPFTSQLRCWVWQPPPRVGLFSGCFAQGFLFSSFSSSPSSSSPFSSSFSSFSFLYYFVLPELFDRSLSFIV